jgi:hypothetical protein
MHASSQTFSWDKNCIIIIIIIIIIVIIIMFVWYSYLF